MTGLSGLSTEELRAAVRAVLRDVLPAALTDGPHPPAGSPADEALTLRDDADLDAFVRHLAARCADPAQRAALTEGRHGYRLAVTTSPASAAADGRPAAAPDQRDGVTRVERGAVTERTVVKAAAGGHRLVLGRRAVLTPLARDRVRSLGVTVEKEG